jgi:hypothetical protein
VADPSPAGPFGPGGLSPPCGARHSVRADCAHCSRAGRARLCTSGRIQLSSPLPRPRREVGASARRERGVRVRRRDGGAADPSPAGPFGPGGLSPPCGARHRVRAPPVHTPAAQVGRDLCTSVRIQLSSPRPGRGERSAHLRAGRGEVDCGGETAAPQTLSRRSLRPRRPLPALRGEAQSESRLCTLSARRSGEIVHDQLSSPRPGRGERSAHLRAGRGEVDYGGETATPQTPLPPGPTAPAASPRLAGRGTE